MLRLLWHLLKEGDSILAKVQDVLDAVSQVDVKVSQVSDKVDALIANQPEDTQPAVDAVNALGAKLDAVIAK